MSDVKLDPEFEAYKKLDSDIATTLGDIGELLAIDISYMKVRFLLEGLETKAKDGDKPAQQVLEIVNQFYKLVKLADELPYPGDKS